MYSLGGGTCQGQRSRRDVGIPYGVKGASDSGRSGVSGGDVKSSLSVGVSEVRLSLSAAGKLINNEKNYVMRTAIITPHKFYISIAVAMFV